MKQQKRVGWKDLIALFLYIKYLLVVFVFSLSFFFFPFISLFFCGWMPHFKDNAINQNRQETQNQLPCNPIFNSHDINYANFSPMNSIPQPLIIGNTPISICSQIQQCYGNELVVIGEKKRDPSRTSRWVYESRALPQGPTLTGFMHQIYHTKHDASGHHQQLS